MVLFLFLGFILVVCTIMLLIFAIWQHQKVSKGPYDDTNQQIDFVDFYNKLRKFVSNEQEKIYAVLGIKNAYNLLVSGIQEDGFCILTDKAAYFIGKVYQKKWIFAFRTNVQHRIVASELKGINVGTLSRFWMLLGAILSIIIEILIFIFFHKVNNLEDGPLTELLTFLFLLLFLGILFSILIDFFLAFYFVLHAFFLKRTNIYIEFSSLTVAFMVSELGKQEIKDFYRAVSEVQELYINIINPISVDHTVNEVRQSADIHADKVTSLSELSKLFEHGMITKEEFEQLKQEVIGSQ